MTHVLAVDDDPHIRELLRLYLEREGFVVHEAGDGAAALALLETQSADIVVLDLMMPGVDGWELCRALRAGSDVPILLLTARDETKDKVWGFGLGVDDYLVKPFDPAELVARLRALLRRSGKLATEPVRFGACILDPATRALSLGTAQTLLTQREVELLESLGSVPGKVWTRSQLLSAVWGYDTDVDDRTVDSTVKRLRRKMDALASEGCGPDGPDEGGVPAIRTLYGVGYRLEGVHW